MCLCLHVAPLTRNYVGDMPLTFMSYFYIGAKARWLMTTTEWPNTSQYKGMIAKFKAAFTKLAGGTQSMAFIPLYDSPVDGAEDDCLPSYDERKEVRLLRTTYDALLALLNSQGSSFSPFDASVADIRPNLHNYAQPIPSFPRDNIVFASRQGGRRNSFVLFTDPRAPLQDTFPRAGQISQIFLHARLEQGRLLVEPFVLIDEFLPLAGAHVAQDPYRAFADLETRVFYHKHTAQRVVRSQDIRCHFAALVTDVVGIDQECIVVRSLDRVSV